MMRRLCSYNHIKKITRSYLVLQCERKIWSPPKNGYAPKYIIDWEICPYIKYINWNMPIMPHAPMWKMTYNLLWGMVMTQNPSSVERNMPRHNGHLKNQSLTKKCVPWYDVSSKMAAYPIKNSLRWLCPSVGSYHNSWSITIKMLSNQSQVSPTWELSNTMCDVMASRWS